MKRQGAQVGGAVLAVAAFLLGAYLATATSWLQPVVTVRVQNNSGQQLRSLVIAQESGSTRLRLESGPVAPGAAAILRFAQSTDGSFRLSATLGNGTSIDTGSYVQPGYSLSYRATASGFVAQ